MIKSIRNIVNLTAAALLTVGLWSCHSSQNATADADNVPYIESIVKGGQTKPSSSVVSGSWSTINIPVKVALKSPSSMSVSGRAQMVYDKCIFISFRMLGMEVATLYADNDSIVVADKFNKRYFSTSYTPMRERYNLSIGMLQNVLLGQPVNISNIGGVSISEEKASSDASTLTALTVSPVDMEPIVFTFGTPLSSDNIVIPSTVTVNTRFNSKNIEAMLTWDVSKAKFNSDIAPTPTQTAGYTRISSTALTSLLKTR
jgi:hypothetical protein